MIQAVAVFSSELVKGEVTFSQMGSDVVIVAKFSALPPGDHGFHIHKAGDLRGEGCQGACDHFTTGSTIHGGPPGSLGGEGKRHTGDLRNIKQEEEKTYTLSNLSVEDLWGRSMIVHADPDDLGLGQEEDSKTTGHSGARIGCAVIGRVDCPPKVGGSRKKRASRKKKCCKH